jgi:hypothetical protein
MASHLAAGQGGVLDQERTPMPNAASPWRSPPGSSDPGSPDPGLAPELAGCEMIYAEMMRTLAVCSRADTELTSIAAIVALGELLSDLIANTGALWVTPDVLGPLRELVDNLEQRRTDEAPGPLHATLRAFFASARPPAAN